MRRVLIILLLCFPSIVRADKVITKDGKTYTGKILIDGDKSVLIGNPPFESESTLIKSEDIATIVYEQYRIKPPAERRRGFSVDLHTSGQVISGSDVSLNPSAGLALSGGFRFHPLIEMGGELQWTPSVSASDGLSISNGTDVRQYESFWLYTINFITKIYPFFNKTQWKTEPYLLAGYGWSHWIPKASGDSMKGEGWLTGVGATRPVTEHIFVDGRFSYQHLDFDTVNFLGQSGTLSPHLIENQYALSLGISYRW